MEFWFGFPFGFGEFFICLGFVCLLLFFFKVLSCCLFNGRFFYKERQESKEMNEHCL